MDLDDFSSSPTITQVTDVQTLTLSGGSGGMVFSLVTPWGTAGPFAYNAATATIQAALVAIGYGTGNYTVAGTPGSSVTFTGAGANLYGPMPVLQVTAVTAGLTASIAHTTVGVNGNVSAADLTDRINFGIRTVSRFIKQFDPSMIVTLPDTTGQYDLRMVCSRKCIEARAVYVNGNPIYNASGKRAGMWTMDEVERFFSPTWRTDTGGISRAAFQLDHLLYLVPAPTAAVTSVRLAGTYLAANMFLTIDDGNEPDLPEELHEAVVRIAAAYAADPFCTEQEGLARLQRFQASAMEDMKDIRRRNERLMQSWGSTSGRGTPTLMLS